MDAGDRKASIVAAQAESGQQRPGSKAQVQTAATNGTGTMRNGEVPSWNGPEQSAGSSAANGDPFTTRLDHRAVHFNPSSTSGHFGRLSELNGNSEADHGPVIVSSTGPSFSGRHPKGQTKTTQLPVGTPASKSVITRPPVTFSTDVGPGIAVPGGHYMKIDDFPRGEIDGILKKLCEEYKWATKLRSMVCPPAGTGSRFVTIWLLFDDMRDAANAMDELKLLCPEAHLTYISQTEFVYGTKANADRGIQKDTSFYDGQLVLTATFVGKSHEFDAGGLYERIVGLCKYVGDIVGVAERIVDANLRHYHVEFQKISDAKYLEGSIGEIEPDRMPGWSIIATEIPDCNRDQTPQQLAASNVTPQKMMSSNGVGQPWTPSRSDTGRTAWIEPQPGKLVPVPGNRQLPKVASITAGIALTPGRRIRGSDPSPITPASCMADVTHMQRTATWPPVDRPPRTVPQGPRRSRMPPGMPNMINVERIQDGIDVRTTIMVRNIPNDMTADELKAVVDKVCFGRYDFIYLRFDFCKNKNVGYAFVNFLLPTDVLKFFHAYNGKEYIPGMGYHPIRGPRLGEIAYATCQGQDCAIEKFRNSSIMCEYPGFRPRLFWTEENAPKLSLVGQVKEFPPINNQTKHNRSKDNAAQIGLYAPKSRNGAVIVRNSQFDRGTPAQMEEDSVFHQQQMMQQPFGYGYNDGGYVLGNQHMSMPMQMPMGMPVGQYGMMYGGQPFNHLQGAMNGSPNAYAPSAPAFHGSPGPVMPPSFTGSPGPMHGNRFHASNLRTITRGHLGVPNRSRFTVRPERDLETAVREIEEGKREAAAYEAEKALEEMQAQEAEEGAGFQGDRVPRFIDGDSNAALTYEPYDYSNSNGHFAGPHYDSGLSNAATSPQANGPINLSQGHKQY